MEDEQGVVTRSQRRARRSSCVARVIVGADDDVVERLHSDDDTFFGELSSTESSGSDDDSEDTDAEQETGDEPSAKKPRLTDDWGDSESGGSDDDTEVDSEPSDAGDDPSGEMTLEEIDGAVAQGCGCSDDNHFSVLPAQQIRSIQHQMSLASSREKDAFILGLLTAGQCEEFVSHARCTGAATRTRTTFNYTVQGSAVCRTVFCAVYGIGSTRLKRLQQSVKSGVCVPAAHGNKGRVPWNQLSGSLIDRVEQFVKNYAMVYGLPMPAAPRGRAQVAPTYLPSSCTYQSVWAEYRKVQQANEDLATYRSFLRIWHKRLPHIQIMSPRADVCAKCEQLRDQLRNASSETAKLEKASALKKHVELAQTEREFYQKCIADAKEKPDEVCHVTFDFAENFAVPYHARQPGPVYFKVLFRVNDFGIINEAACEQIHHLYHEGQTIKEDNGKSHGPNCVISMLHRYLEKNPHARNLHAHCDNCCGQNKNKSVLAYLCWRVLCGLEDSISLSFMVVGHTRCAVDGGFGVAKKAFRASDTDTAPQLVDLINGIGLRNKAVPVRLGVACMGRIPPS